MSTFNVSYTITRPYHIQFQSLRLLDCFPLTVSMAYSFVPDEDQEIMHHQVPNSIVHSKVLIAQLQAAQGYFQLSLVFGGLLPVCVGSFSSFHGGFAHSFVGKMVCLKRFETLSCGCAEFVAFCLSAVLVNFLSRWGTFAY